MTYKIKIPPKELPADEAHLMSGMEHVLDRLQEHRQMVLLGALLVLLVVGALGVVLWLDHQNSERAMELTRQATRLYMERPVGNPSKADETLKQAIKLFAQVVDEYPRTSAAPLALFHLGNAEMQSKNGAAAITSYKKFIATYGTNKLLLGMVYQRLGYAYMLNGDREQAEKALAAALEVPGALNKDQVVFELAKLEEAQSRPEAALARYQELIKNFPSSPFASEAAVRMKALEVKKPPEPAAPPASGSQEGNPSAATGASGVK